LCQKTGFYLKLKERKNFKIQMKKKNVTKIYFTKEANQLFLTNTLNSFKKNYQ